MSKLIARAIKTPDGTILYSRHRHDYQTYTDANGDTYMIDGGLAYLRMNVNDEPAKILEVYTDDPHERIRKHFAWGSYGVKGDEPLHYIFLKDMEVEHISAILNLDVVPHVKEVFKNELEYRNGN